MRAKSSRIFAAGRFPILAFHPATRVLSGGHGNLSRPFLQVLNLLYFKAQLLDLQGLAYFWLVAVIWGCLAVFSTGFSTISAQDGHSIVHLTPFNLSQRQVISGRRRRRAGRAELTQAELIAATYSRFSSDKQSETSITDQRRNAMKQPIAMATAFGPNSNMPMRRFPEPSSAEMASTRCSATRKPASFTFFISTA